MKGTAGNFGARRVQSLAGELEEVCKREDAAAMTAIIAQIGEASAIAWALVEKRFPEG